MKKHGNALVVSLALLALSCSSLISVPDKEPGEDASSDPDAEALDISESDGGDVDDPDVAEDADALEVVDDGDDEDAVDPCTIHPTWFRDTDGDTYGNDDDTVCAAEAPSGYVGRGGDCCDSDSAVRPNQTGWFTNSYRCPSGTHWDYNCDGVATKRYVDQYDCPMGLSGGHWGCRYDDFTPGWSAGTPPNCGITAPYVTACNFSGTYPSDYCICPCGTDFWETEDRTQSCH